MTTFPGSLGDYFRRVHWDIRHITLYHRIVVAHKHKITKIKEGQIKKQKQTLLTTPSKGKIPTSKAQALRQETPNGPWAKPSQRYIYTESKKVHGREESKQAQADNTPAENTHIAKRGGAPYAMCPTNTKGADPNVERLQRSPP